MSIRLLAVAAMLWLAGCATAPQSPTQPVRPPAEPAPVAPPPSAMPAETEVSRAAPAVTPAPSSRPAPRMQMLEEFAEHNDDKLLHVYSGMSRAAVERLMDGRQSGSYVNPYKRQVLNGAGGKTYEVLFYVTRAPRAGRRVTESQLTPVIFSNDQVVAIGRYPLKKLRRAACQAGGGTACP